MDEVYSKITDKTKLVSIAQMSNVLGTIYPVKEIMNMPMAWEQIVVMLLKVFPYESRCSGY